MPRALRKLVNVGSFMWIPMRCQIVRGLTSRGVRQATLKEFGREPDNLVTLLVDRDHVIAIVQQLDPSRTAQMARQVFGISWTGNVVVPGLQHERWSANRG